MKKEKEYNNLNFFLFDNVKAIMNQIKKMQFQDSYIIIKGSKYKDFILKFKKNLKRF